jgi:hypothetical protein
MHRLIRAKMTKKILTPTATIAVAHDALPQETIEEVKPDPVAIRKQRIVDTLIENITAFERRERDRRELYIPSPYVRSSQKHVDGLCIELTKYVADKLLAHELVGVQPMVTPIEVDMLHPLGVGQLHLLSVKYSPTPERMLFPFEIARRHDALPEPSEPSGHRLNILIEKHVIEAATRNMALRHTFFAAEDCLAATGVPLDIPTVLGEELLAELDQDMLLTLAHLATDTNSSFTSHPLPNRIISNASLIAAKTRRGAGNWCVLSPKAYAEIREVQGYESIREPSETQISHVGTLAGSIKVFHSPSGMQDADVLVGYKGNDIDCGLVYCPFLLAYTNGLCIDPSTFEPIVMFRTRRGIFCQTKSDTRLNDVADYYTRFTIG